MPLARLWYIFDGEIATQKSLRASRAGFMTITRSGKKNRRCESDLTPQQIPAVSRGVLRVLTRAILPASLAAILALIGFSVVAQTPSPTQVVIAPEPDAQALAIDRGAAGLWQLLLKLHTR